MTKEIKKYSKDNLNTQDVKKANGSLKFLRFAMMFAKVVSMILFVAAIVFTVMHTVGSIWVIENKDVVVGTRTLETLILTKYGVSVYACSSELVSLALVTAGVIPVAWFSWRYFGNMYRDKTPFTFKTAKAGVRLSIIAAGCGVLGIIFQAIIHLVYFVKFGDQVGRILYIQWIHIVYAVMILIQSFINRYGAQVREDARLAAKK